MRDFLEKLRQHAWRTAGARYNAARRLKRRDWIATFSIAIFSAVGIAIAVAQKVYSPKPSSDLDNYLTVAAVCIGLFVIVISLIEWGFSAAVKADALYRNAESLNRHQRKVAQVLAAGGEIAEASVTLLREEYERIKDSCPYNHEPVDHRLFTAQHRLSIENGDTEGKPTMTWFGATWATLMDVLSSAKGFLIFWVVILLLLAMTPWSRSESRLGQDPACACSYGQGVNDDLSTESRFGVSG